MSTTITPEKAKGLIQEYRAQNAAAGGPGLVTPDKRHHNGFFIDRASLEEMLSNPKVAGVSLSFAKHPDHVGSPDNIFTLVYGGAEPAPAGSPTPYVSSGKLMAVPPPCPPTCVS